MPIIKPVRNIHPQISEDCFVAENATIVGEVTMGSQCSIWFNAVVRGDVHYIKMGNKVNIQDGAVIHTTYQKSPTTIGNNVSIATNTIISNNINKNSIVYNPYFFKNNSLKIKKNINSKKIKKILNK